MENCDANKGMCLILSIFLSRQGFLEDRDPARIKDRNNELIVCFKCHRTALPRLPAISIPPSPTLDGPVSHQQQLIASGSSSPRFQTSTNSSTVAASSASLASTSTAPYGPQHPHGIQPPPGPGRPERRAKLAADLALQATRIISCDYCSLHWHLDCLDPPLVQMPSPLKKWMCPAHAEHEMVRTIFSYSGVYFVFTV